MSSIHTLITDIQFLLTTKGWFTDAFREELSREIGRRLQTQFSEADRTPRLRLSAMGPRCPKALWYSIHHPEMAEKMPPWVENKFAFGHITEAWAIALAKAAGHTVTGEQDELIVDGIAGHRDCVIDGCIVDVKSSASRSFEKFKKKTLAQDDAFGYLDQLDGYLYGSREDNLVTVKDTGYLFAIDKQLGHMVLYEHTLREAHIKQRVASYKSIVELDTPPHCECETRPEGKSGNIALGVKASYSPYKHVCFPNLRTFVYATGPVFLTEVNRKPDVQEVDKDGHYIYH